jgi:hypothetical protein
VQRFFLDGLRNKVSRSQESWRGCQVEYLKGIDVRLIEFAVTVRMIESCDMTTPLQGTKLFAPAARAQLVHRPRLLERLQAIQLPGCKALVISAPAGSGKSTLVIQCLASQ